MKLILKNGKPLQYWNTAESLGLTEDEITEIVERLWKEEIANSTQSCHDCAAKPGELHESGCDVERCNICGGQAISCGHTEHNEEIWTGMWPGTKECYEQRLITYMNPGSNNYGEKPHWTFDLNTLERKRRGLSA